MDKKRKQRKKIDLLDIGIDIKDVVKRLEKESRSISTNEWKKIKKESGIRSQQFTNVFGNHRINPSLEMVIKLTHLMGKPLDYILYGKKNLNESIEDDHIGVPFISPLMNKDLKIIINNEKCCYVNKELIQAKTIYSMKVEGNIMSPTLKDGDIIIIDYSKKHIIDGKIYLFHTKNMPFIQTKRLYFFEDKIKAMPDNNSFDSYLICINDIKIIGQVIIVFKRIE